MGWEDRGGQLYYYRKRRNGPVVSSEYFGSGSVADLISEMDRMDREERRLERTKRAEKRIELAELDAQAAAFSSAVRAILSAALIISGFRPHKGQWRKRRHVQ